MKHTIADYYDLMMNEVDYDEWAILIDKLIKPHLIGNKLMEIGCGTGEIAVRLLNKGYDIKAIDNSKDMISKAKAKYKEIEFEEIDMRNLNANQCYDAVVAVFDTINYLNSLDDLKKSFENIKSSLKSKGVFLFDVLNRKMMDSMFEEESFIDDKEDIIIIWRHQYDKMSELDEINISFFIKKRENIYLRHDEKFIKKIFSQKEIRKIAEESGFEILYREVSTDIAGPRIVYLLQRVD